MTSIRVNFKHRFPLFPLPGAVLLPHAVQPMQVIEPRYRAMIDAALDGSGQIAVAMHDPVQIGSEPVTAIRPVVCLGQVAHHESVPGGYEVLLHGVCRATIKELFDPEADRNWCEATLTPLESLDEEPPMMPKVRDELYQLLVGEHLSTMRPVESIVQWFEREDVTTHALLELIGSTLVQDEELRYQLLSEPEISRRSDMIRVELLRLDRMLGQAFQQRREDYDHGIHWN